MSRQERRCSAIGLSKADLRLFRIGFVFQQFNPLAPITGEENVAFPLEMQKLGKLKFDRRTDDDGEHNR